MPRTHFPVLLLSTSMVLGGGAASRRVIVKMRKSATRVFYLLESDEFPHQACTFSVSMYRWHNRIDVEFGNVRLFDKLNFRWIWKLRPSSSGGFTSQHCFPREPTKYRLSHYPFTSEFLDRWHEAIGGSARCQGKIDNGAEDVPYVVVWLSCKGLISISCYNQADTNTCPNYY